MGRTEERSGTVSVKSRARCTGRLQEGFEETTKRLIVPLPFLNLMCAFNSLYPRVPIICYVEFVELV